jgi:hypothetical protein
MLRSSNFIKPFQLTFLTTNTCTAACSHCSVNSSPSRKGSLTSAQMIKTIDQFIASGPLQVIIFAGGEPTLLGNALLETIAYADSIGLITRMVTNAHWATSPESAHIKLNQLREAGLRELNISCDDYHTPFIPVNRIRFAWNCSKGMGFDAVVIASASGPDSILTPARIREILEEDVPLFYDEDGAGPNHFPRGEEIRIISNSQVSRLGRGVDNVPTTSLKFPKSQSILDVGCRWIGGSPAISPNNHLLSCCGMEANGRKHLDYGNLEMNDVPSLLADAQRDVVVAAISTLGPFKIMKFLKSVEPSAKFWPLYSGVCEMCAHIFARPDVVALLDKHLEALELLVAMAERKQTLHSQPAATSIITGEK